MLKSWTIENFKAIKDKKTLKLSGLTVFAGANSSGKSSIIQSMLLLKQTLEHAPPSRPLALNGPILKLGRFDDVLHVSSSSAYISFGAEHCSSDTALVSDPLENPFSVMRYNFPYNSLSFLSSFTSKQDSELAQLQPYLASSTISATPDSPKNGDFNDIGPTAKETLSIKENISRSSSQPAFLVTKITPKIEQEALEEQPKAKIVGAKPRHFLPDSITIKYDIGESLARKITDIICSSTPNARARSYEAYETRLPAKIFNFIKETITERNHSQQQDLLLNEFGQENSDDRLETYSVFEIIEYIRKHSQRQVIIEKSGETRKIFIPSISLLQEKSNEIENLLIKHFGTGNTRTDEAKHTLTKNYFFFDHFFTNLTKYLGPLRDEPRPLYPLEILTSPKDVGYRGEHTAAVLELHKNTRVSYIPPKAIETNSIPKIGKTASLHDAAVEWLSYLGVAEDIQTSDKGKFGHEMQVKAEGFDKAHDLTNVGVGVSQVLPIVIMALLSESGSLLIFEQPELHLHPKVQSRLADFFISLTLIGKQCLVETHSEYLIHRLRLRIAQSDTDEIRSNSTIYFVERQDGSATYNEVQVSEYGAISNWPEDFFDQTDREIENILIAARKKKSKSTNKTKNKK